MTVQEDAAQHSLANRQAWEHWAELGSVSSRPVGHLDPSQARQLVDPDGWLPWKEIREVLCLGGGGGQQAPAFATLGCAVTVLDSSPAQLALDRAVAERDGLDLRCVEADMCDLGSLGLSGFDLVLQPVSSCYVSDVRPVHQGVREVLRPGGWYRAEHWNPVHMRLWSAPRPADQDHYVLPAAGHPTDPIVTTVAAGPAGEALLESWTFPHTLAELVGNLCDTGFVVRRFAEDCGGDASAPVGSDEHLAALVPPFFRLLARRIG
jgi:SAM-dependent methyltransferase